MSLISKKPIFARRGRDRNLMTATRPNERRPSSFISGRVVDQETLFGRVLFTVDLGELPELSGVLEQSMKG